MLKHNKIPIFFFERNKRECFFIKGKKRILKRKIKNKTSPIPQMSKFFISVLKNI